MSKIIYDVIQRFEVENGVPHLISTNIQVIEGGDDLMSLALNQLKELGFYDKFDEINTAQYIGYRLKTSTKGYKRYQLVLAQRKDCLCVSVPKNLDCFAEFPKLTVKPDKLFPYAEQVSIISKQMLRDFLNHVVKVIVSKQR